MTPATEYDPVADTLTLHVDPMAFILSPEEWRRHCWRKRCRANGISENAIWVCEWIDRMAERYGGIVRGHGRAWDWGQALCVERYGPDPDKWSGDPTDADIARAKAWEVGRWPRWAKRP